jgi:hypothetical protein
MSLNRLLNRRSRLLRRSLSRSNSSSSIFRTTILSLRLSDLHRSLSNLSSLTLLKRSLSRTTRSSIKTRPRFTTRNSH